MILLTKYMQRLSSPVASMDNIPCSIPTYAINLKKRSDRKNHLLEQFNGRNEFSLRIVEAFEHSFGALGLWMTIRYIIQDLVAADSEYIIICEDDIEFTSDYSKENLFRAITAARKQKAEVLLGGVSWFDEAVHVEANLFWTNKFNGLHFTIIFKDFFAKIICTQLQNYIAADFKISELTTNILFVHPFMAMQKEFGYSDATEGNNIQGRVQSLFFNTHHWTNSLKRIKSLYKSIPVTNMESGDLDFEQVTIPTYIINLPERTERLEYILNEFSGKPEFDIKVIPACKHEIGALGLWLSIRKIIELAISCDDDIIIICEDDHQFTSNYSKEYLISNILESHEQGACILSGGTGGFRNVIPITPNRYWVKHCLSTQFVIIFKRFFQQILDEPFDEKIVADLTYSKMTSNIMVLYPFISIQKNFGYSDITASHQENKSLLTEMFIQSDLKLKGIQEAYLKYQ